MNKISRALLYIHNIVADAANKSQSVYYIVDIINKLLNVFAVAGIILLAYSVFSLILAIKDENAESKVHAITQLGVAVTLVVMWGTIKALAAIFHIGGINSPF